MLYFTEFSISFVFTFVVIVITYYVFHKNKSNTKLEEVTGCRKEEADLDEENKEKEEPEKDKIDLEDFKEFLIKAEELKELQDDFQEPEEPFVDEAIAKNIHTMYKNSRLHLKEMEQQMSEDEKEQERLAKQSQLEEIFKLMSQEQEKFGIQSVDQIQEQMKMYSCQ